MTMESPASPLPQSFPAPSHNWLSCRRFRAHRFYLLRLATDAEQATRPHEQYRCDPAAEAAFLQPLRYLAVLSADAHHIQERESALSSSHCRDYAPVARVRKRLFGCRSRTLMATQPRPRFLSEKPLRSDVLAPDPLGPLKSSSFQHSYRSIRHVQIPLAFS